MRLWIAAHRTIMWIIPLIICAALSGLVGNERLPSLNLTGMYIEGFPIRVAAPALAAVTVIGPLAAETPKAKATAGRSIFLVEAAQVAGLIVLAGVIAESISVLTDSGDLGVFTRNLAGMVGAGLIIRRFLGTQIGVLTPLVWGVILLSIGNPNGDHGFSWPGLSEVTAASLLPAITLTLLGLALGVSARPLERRI